MTPDSNPPTSNPLAAPPDRVAKIPPTASVILVVDDHFDNLDLLSAVLSHRGHTVHSYMSGAEALAQVHQIQPDLILLDVMMPEMTGYEVCQQLKQDPRTQPIPILFLSALSEAADKVKGFQLGAADYITKPFNLRELLARVEHQLILRHLQAQLFEQNQALQREIEERKRIEQTLREKSDRLTQALTELQAMQAQMLQREKMVSLGQLVAGVTHEINNPINFIQGNLVHTANYTRSLLQLLHLYQEQFPQGSPPIAQFAEPLDLEFMAADLPKLIHSMEVGTQRILAIVRSLQVFSKLDEADWQVVDLHEGLESTLLLLHSRLVAQPNHPAITLHRQYQPDLPRIPCHAGQMNQVFMALLNNAIDALEAAARLTPEGWSRSRPPTIAITTQSSADRQITIRVSDNGIGIAPEIQSRIFDPFFTTKPVGKGSGLGLAIAYQIITQQHGGQIRCRSHLHQGTSFWLEIPLHSRELPH